MTPQLAFSSVTFGSPLLLMAAPLLAILYLIFRRVRHAVAIPSLDLGREFPITWRIWIRAPLLALLSLIFVMALAFVAARPQRIAAIENVKERRNLILTLDLSRSMSAVDFEGGRQTYSRMSAVKNVVKKFVGARPDDRIGIVVFGNKAFVQAPLTLDHAMLVELIGQLDVGLAGDGTAIGDGIGLSLKRLKDVPSNSAAIILITDGVSNAGQLDPQAVAQIAKEKRKKIHTIGIGSGQGLIRGNSGIFINQGQPAEFDEATLQAIAQTTGGVYFNASNIEGLTKVYEEIDQLERTEREDPREQIVENLFTPLALSALITYLLFLFSSRVILMKVP